MYVEVINFRKNNQLLRLGTIRVHFFFLYTAITKIFIVFIKTELNNNFSKGNQERKTKKKKK